MSGAAEPVLSLLRLNLRNYFTAVLICAAGVVLIGLQLAAAGWLLLAISAVSLLLTDRAFAQDMLLIIAPLAILGVTPINTDISPTHMAVMGCTLGLAVLLPYLISRFVYHDDHVRFQWLNGRYWYTSETLRIAIFAISAYLLLPYYLRSTGAYLHWPSAVDRDSLVRLFIGTNALGIWDELFFISTVFGLLRRYFSFAFANIMQAVLFSAFLYELGFTSWGCVMIFVFACMQGYIFMKTHSLLYVIAIHLTLDLVLFLAIIYTHHPQLLPIFLT